MKNYLLKLTLAVYRVTDKFPEKEPLKYSIREVAGRIFTFAVTSNGCNRQNLECDLELLKSYFLIAKTQNWVSERNFLVLEREYDKIAEAFSVSTIASGPQKSKKREKGIAEDLLELNSNRSKPGRVKRNLQNTILLSPPERKQKIANIIKERERIAFAELVASFPEISRRTLIRDLQNLLKEETIKKQGNGRGVIYMPNGLFSDKSVTSVTD